MKELRTILAAFANLSEPAALATIVKTEGSSYRRPGTRMLVLPGGTWTGTLSGGCVEEDTAARAMNLIAGGGSELFTIDTQLRFGCPGLLTIFIERIEPRNPFLAYLSQCISRRCAAEIVVHYENSPSPSGSYACRDAPCLEGGFRQTIPPPIRLVIAGGGADTDALKNFADALGWDVVVLEGAELIGDYADARTALVVKNHNFGRDVASLARGVANTFGYVGLVSSRKRRRRIIRVLDEEYMQAGVHPQLYGPAGLDIGADSPEEVALSIVAEIQAVMAGHEGGFLRGRANPIHDSICKTARQ